MKDFDLLCKEVEALDFIDYNLALMRLGSRVKPALNVLTDDPAEVNGMLAMFMIASVYADGKLDEAEYAMMLPLLHTFFGETFDFEEVKQLVNAFKPEGKELMELVDHIVDLIGELSEELKDDLIMICLLICAVDGKVSLREKKYIKQLIR